MQVEVKMQEIFINFYHALDVVSVFSTNGRNFINVVGDADAPGDQFRGGGIT